MNSEEFVIEDNYNRPKGHSQILKKIQVLVYFNPTILNCD